MQKPSEAEIREAITKLRKRQRKSHPCATEWEIAIDALEKQLERDADERYDNNECLECAMHRDNGWSYCGDCGQALKQPKE